MHVDVTARNNGCPDCLGYLQQRPGGFRVTFGSSTTVTANEYVVEVLNDQPQSGSTFRDIVNVSWASDYPPPLGSPLAQLMVNGNGQTVGRFTVSLVASDENLFSDVSLPTVLEPDSFTDQSVLIFADTLDLSGFDLSIAPLVPPFPIEFTAPPVSDPSPSFLSAPEPSTSGLVAILWALFGWHGSGRNRIRGRART